MFNRSFWPETAATGQFLTELAVGLVEDFGCRVSAVAGVPLVAVLPGSEVAGDGLTPGRHVHRGVEILRTRGTQFSKRRFAGRFSNYVTYFLAACAVGLRLERPDVVVACTDPPIIGLAGWLAARRYNARFVMSYQDVFPEVARLLEDFRSEAVDRVLAAVNRFLVLRADRVVALGETMRRRLVESKGADPARTVVIPNWADCSAIAPGDKRNAFSEAHGLADRFVVMHSGNLGLSQGLEHAVEAAARLRDLPDLVWVFVGDGVKRSQLEILARHAGATNVRFLPYQPVEVLSQSFASADVFLISLKRGLAGYIVPSKLYGILAAGRPYVAAVEEECEVTAVTRKYDCGLLAQPEDAEDLAEKVRILYRDPDLRRRLGENARRTALHFDRRLGVQAYYDLFCELTGRPSA